MTNTISRRSLAKGAAWSVPAVVAASSVPALAASPSRDCEQGPYLRVEQPVFIYDDPEEPLLVRAEADEPAATAAAQRISPDSVMTGFISTTSDPMQGGTHEWPRDAQWFAVNLLLTTTGELAAGTQVTMNLQWEQTDVWYLDNPDNKYEPFRQEKVTTTLPTGKVFVGKGDRNALIERAAEDPVPPVPLTPLTEVTVNATPGGSTSRTITFILNDTVATERAIPLVLILPGDPVEPGEKVSTGIYEEERTINLSYTSMSVDTSGCTYAATSGSWAAYSGSS